VSQIDSPLLLVKHRVSKRHNTLEKYCNGKVHTSIKFLIFLCPTTFLPLQHGVLYDIPDQSQRDPLQNLNINRSYLFYTQILTIEYLHRVIGLLAASLARFSTNVSQRSWKIPSLERRLLTSTVCNSYDVHTEC